MLDKKIGLEVNADKTKYVVMSQGQKAGRSDNIKTDNEKGKGLPQQAEVAQGIPGSLRPRIFLTFGTTRVVGRHPYTPAAFTPGEIPGTHF